MDSLLRREGVLLKEDRKKEELLSASFASFCTRKINYDQTTRKIINKEKEGLQIVISIEHVRELLTNNEEWIWVSGAWQN